MKRVVVVVMVTCVLGAARAEAQAIVDFLDTVAWQRNCQTTGSVPAMGKALVCVSWPFPFGHCTNRYPCAVDLDCSGMGGSCTLDPYVPSGQVQDESAETAIPGLRLHHLTSMSATNACGLILNEDAGNARSGSLCLDALRVP
jgi:hypothetical protein